MRVYCAAGVTVALAATLSGGVGATWATAQVPRTQTEFGGPVYPASRVSSVRGLVPQSGRLQVPADS